MEPEVIINAEPAGFSALARATWSQVGEYREGSLDDPALLGEIRRATVLIVRLARRIDAALLDRMPRLKCLVSATTGCDHVDARELSIRGIRLLCLRGEHAFLAGIPSTAEHTMALLLALMRHVPAAHRSVAQGEWQRDRFRGRQLKGRRLGLVGMGRTGSMVAGYAAAFGMRIAYFDPHVEARDATRFDSLEALLENSEIVSLHVHLDAATQGLLGAARLARMPRGGWLVNTSRGGLVDERALADALRSGQLAGAAVDVLASELDDVRSSPLLEAARDGCNVIITPHIGGATVDAMHQCEEFVAARFRETRETHA